MRLLFLDVDGVLNNMRTAVVYRYGNPGSLDKGFDPLFDHLSVGILKHIVEKFDFKIVLSSTWRLGYNIQELKTIWLPAMDKFYNWPNFPLIDRTSNKTFGVSEKYPAGQNRGHQINDYLQDFGKPVNDYIILDDDSDMTDYQKEEGHFYRVSRFTGLGIGFIDYLDERYGASRSWQDCLEFERNRLKELGKDAL